MTPDERKARAEKAKRILDDPMFSEAWGRLETDVLKAWKASRDPVERERLWHAQDVLDKLKNAFDSYVRDGKLAQRDIDKIAEAPRGKPAVQQPTL